MKKMKPIPLEDPKPINNRFIFLILLGLFICGCIIWYLFIPIEKYSFVYWAGLILMFIPTWIAFERIGNILFSDKLGRKMTRGFRILYGVIVLGILLIFISIGETTIISYFGIR